MAIKVSGTTVIDNERNANAGVVTATSLDVYPEATTFSPADGASDVALNSNIVITYNANIVKGSGNITLRDGSASGTILETIAVSSGTVSISGGEVTINPSSDFPTGKDIFVVVDAGCFENSIDFLNGTNPLLNTYNFTTGPITVSSFSPSDGANDQSVSTNILITFSENITKGSGNITIRSGSASGSALQTIDVTSGAVSVSGTQATINPPSDLAYETDQYIVVDAGCFRNSDGDVASGNAIINTYNFTTETELSLGDSHEGGCLICCSSNNYWIVGPKSSETIGSWASRTGAVSQANSVAACGDWFIPNISQLQNPGHACRAYWDDVINANTPQGYYPVYWSNQESTSNVACSVHMRLGHGSTFPKSRNFYSRAFRCVSY